MTIHATTRPTGDARAAGAPLVHGTPVRQLRRCRRATASLAGGALALGGLGASVGSGALVLLAGLCAALGVLYVVQLRRVQRQLLEPERHARATNSWSDGELAAWLPSAAGEVRRDPTGTLEALRAAAPLVSGRAQQRLLDRWAITQMLWAGLVGSFYNGLLALAGRLATDSSMGWLRRRLLTMTTAAIAYLGRRSMRTVALCALASASTTGLAAGVAGAATGPTAASRPAAVHAVLTDATVTAAAPSASSGTYTVQPGDTLSALAARFGTTVQAIAAANGIENPNLIFVGQVLTIPSGATTVNAGTTTPGTPSPAPSSPGAYANPLRSVSSLVPERIDQGVDFSGSGPIYAIGDGVVRNTTNPGWPDGGFITYQLTDGPAAGDFVYVAENVVPRVQVGQQVTPTTVVGTLVDAGPGLETGWAQPPGDGNAAASGQWNTSTSTAYGENFSQLLQSLGAPGGVTEGSTQGALPAGWPTW